MVFAPRRTVPPCSALLAGSLLPVVSEFPDLGVILIPTMSCIPHARHLVSCRNRLFAQCVAWIRAERLRLRFASTLFTSYVLPSTSWGSEFLLTSLGALRLLNSALRRWGRFLKGWPHGSPVASVFLELGWPDDEHLATSRLLSLFGRVHAMPSGDRCPLPVTIFRLVSADPRSWPSACFRICSSLYITLPASFGSTSGSFPSCVHSWFRSCAFPRLGQSLHYRLCSAASVLSVSHVDLRFSCVNLGPDTVVYGRSCLPAHARFWGLARWGHDPFPGGRSARHLGFSFSCVLCDALYGDLAHSLSTCLAFSDLHEQWCRRVSVTLDAASHKACNACVFNPHTSPQLCSYSCRPRIFRRTGV